MPHHHSIGKEFSHHYHQFLHSLFLLWSASISESPLFIPSAFVADANMEESSAYDDAAAKSCDPSVDWDE